MAIGVPIASITDNNDTCYMIAYTDTDSITIKAYNLDSSEDYYLRIFVRLANDTSDITYNKVFEKSGSHSYSFTVSGLDSGTDYIMNFGDCPDSTGDGVDWWGATEFSTYTTDEPTISSISVDGTDVTIKWKNQTGSSAMYVITTNNYIKDFGNVGSSSSITRTAYVSYDNYDTTYSFYLFTLASDGTSNYTIDSVTTGSQYENITISITDYYVEGTVATVEWEVLTGELDSFAIIANNSVDKTSISTTISSGNIYTSKIPFDRFNTTYKIKIQATGIEGETYTTSNISITTEGLEKWYWNKTNTSTGWLESDALNNKGPFNTITAERWQAFVAHYNGLMRAAYTANLTTNTFTATWENLEQMMADDFWGFITQTNSMFINAGLSDYYTRPDEALIQSGQKIYGSYITDLTTAYNQLTDYILDL